MAKTNIAPRILIGVAVLVIALVAWRAFGLSERLGIFALLDQRLTVALAQPYFTFGNLEVTPALLVQSLIFLLLLVFFSRQAIKVLRRLALDRSGLDQGQKYAIERTTLYGLYFLGILVGLQAAGLDLSTLTVFGGALGVGVAFGLQAITNNFVSGLILLFERPVKVGDRIEVSGLNGDIIRIGARATWVRTNDGIEVIVPNSEFVVKAVTNWTAGDRIVRFRLNIGVSYSADPERVREIMLTEAHKHPDVLDKPPPDVIFLGYGSSSIDFELRVWTQTRVQTHLILKSDLYFAIFKAFAEAGIEIPFPQRVLHMRSVSDQAAEVLKG